MHILRSRVAAVAIGAAVVTGIGAGSATAAALITSADIKDGSIQAVDIHKGAVAGAQLAPSAVTDRHLSPALKAELAQHGTDGSDGADGATGATGPRGPRGARGPQGVPGEQGEPGLSNVIAGAGYTRTWAGDQGAQLNTIIETCPDGQVALGGGYSTWGGSDVNAGGTAYDLGGDNKDIQVTVSAPYYEETYDPNKYGGNIRPTEWVVKGYNNGATDQIVRAWVVCADAN